MNGAAGARADSDPLRYPALRRDAIAGGSHRARAGEAPRSTLPPTHTHIHTSAFLASREGAMGGCISAPTSEPAVAAPVMVTRQTVAYDDQKPGTSGLRKKVRGPGGVRRRRDGRRGPRRATPGVAGAVLARHRRRRPALLTGAPFAACAPHRTPCRPARGLPRHVLSSCREHGLTRASVHARTLALPPAVALACR